MSKLGLTQKHGPCAPRKVSAGAFVALLLALVAPAGATAASWTDSVRPRASWTDSRPSASWTDVRPAASWTDARPAASWTDARPSASWTDRKARTMRTSQVQRTIHS